MATFSVFRRLPLVMAVLASGCSFFRPDYQKPQVEPPAAFRAAPADAGPSSFADLGWWEVYRDPQLAALIGRGLERNRDLRIATARIAEARASLGTADYALLPQIGANAAASRSRVTSVGSTPLPPNSGPMRRNYRATIDASYEIDFWGRIAATTDAARADVFNLEAARDVVHATLVSDIAAAYFDLLALDRQIAISQRTLETRQRFLTLTQARVRAGAATRLEADRAEAALNAVRTTIPELRRRAEQGENLLRALTGDYPSAVARNAAAATALPPAPDVPPGLPSQLLDRRPDIRAAEQAIIAANARVAAQRAALMPSFSLTGSLGTESGSLTDFLTGPSKVWSLGGGLFAPLINAQRNKFLVEAARAREVQALEQYQRVVETSMREVADALVNRRDYAEVRDGFTAQVGSLREVERVVLRRYEAGLATYLEVVDAQRDLFQAELAVAVAQRNLLVASVQLYKALGGGWRSDGMPAVSGSSAGPGS